MTLKSVSKEPALIFPRALLYSGWGLGQELMLKQEIGTISVLHALHGSKVL